MSLPKLHRFRVKFLQSASGFRVVVVGASVVVVPSVKKRKQIIAKMFIESVKLSSRIQYGHLPVAVLLISQTCWFGSQGIWGIIGALEIQQSHTLS